MLNTHKFNSVAALDKAYADHLDSLLAGGFIKKDSREYKDFMGAWAEAAKDLEDSLTKPRFDSLS